jgi:hypothetical protein
MLGEEIIELKDGLNSFQANAFESLYDKKVTWAKNSSNTNSESKEITTESKESVAVSPPSEVAVAVAVVEEVKEAAKDIAAEIIDEAPRAKKVVDVTIATPKVIVPVPAVVQEIPVKVADVVVAAVAEKVVITPSVAEKVVITPPMAAKVVPKEAAPVAAKSVVEPKKSGGFFGFLQSDTAVQQIANKNQPTAPPAIAKAFMTPTPAKTEVKKEARKSPEGLNMAMFKQDPEEIEAKKAMMAARPSLASAKAEAAKSSDERIPSGKPIKAPETAVAESKGMFSFLTPPEAAEEDVAPAMAMAKKPVAAVTKAVTQPPAPTPPKKAPAPGGLFSFLTSDPSLVAPGDPDARPTGPPAVARAFMTPAASDSDAMSAAAMRRKAEYDQDVKDEEVKSKMMASRPSIADLKVEASKTLSKQQMRDAAAKAAGAAPVKKAPAPGLFDFFSQDSGSSDDGDLFEPRDPNAMTEKEVAMTIAPTVRAVAAPKKAAVVPAPAPKAAAETTPAASGGMFGFLNSGPAAKAAPAESKVVPAVATAKKAAPVPTPVAKAPAPPAAASGGMFGFLNSGPAAKAAPTEPKVVPAVATAKKAAPVPTPVAKAPAPPAASGGFFGFLGSSAPAESAKVEAKAAPAVAVAKKVAPPPPRTAVNVKAAVPAAVVSEKSVAPSGGFFGFLNSSPPQDSKPRPTSSVASSSAKPVQAVGMNVKFLASISRLLKGDSSKIKAFQSATDSFRSGAVSGDSFLKTLETLFGADALESVVVPLVSELPERDAAVKLRASFDKKMSSMKKGAEPAKAPFSFSFGAPKKVEVPVPVVVVPPPKKEGFSFPSFGAPKAPAATPMKATTTIKIPTGVPAAKKTSVETQIKQLLAGGDVKVFYKNISKELGRPKTVEVMPEIIKGLPKPIGLKVEAVFKADK